MEFQIKERQNISNHCFVCGIKNPIGLQAKFYASKDGETIAIFTPDEMYQSYPGILHGGISATILDETIGRAIMNAYGQDSFGVTMEMNVKYKKPVPTDVQLKVVGRINRDRGRVFEGTGEIYLPDGTVAVSASGKYLKRALKQITDDEFSTEEWFESDATVLDKINI